MTQPPPQDEELIRRIESGEYYRDARDWYTRLYITPISQRLFFIIVTGFAVAFTFMALGSVMNLLPISPRVPFVYRNDNIMEQIPRMERFKKPAEEADPALIRYFLETYIEQREGYNADGIRKRHAFVRQYSSEQELREYMQTISQNNPQSPVRRYGRYRDLLVQIRRVSYNREQIPYQATVDFSTIVTDLQTQQKTDWTATITFEYTDLTVRNTYDESLGDYVLDYDEPQFKVLNYEKRERLSGVR